MRRMHQQQEVLFLARCAVVRSRCRPQPIVIGKIHLKLKKVTKPEANKTFSNREVNLLDESDNLRIETKIRFTGLEHATYLEGSPSRGAVEHVRERHHR